MRDLKRWRALDQVKIIKLKDLIYGVRTGKIVC